MERGTSSCPSCSATPTRSLSTRRCCPPPDLGNPRPYGVELRNKTVGVVGTGLIGKEVVRRLQGCDVTILVSDVVKDEAFARQYGARYVELPELFREADAITLHAPLLPAT